VLEYIVLPTVMSAAFVLASNSPRRRQLLALAGVPFTACSADVDERPYPGEPAGSCVVRLARMKAEAAAGMLSAGGKVILSFDTVVVDHEILGKPAGAEEAVRVLRQLRGRSHRVFTGLVVSDPHGRVETDVCITTVPMRNYSEVEILAYVQSGDPLDKAGSYAIQHPGFHPVESLAGCYAGVMGLPLCHLARTLHKMGMDLPGDIAANCQSTLQYTCPISSAVLRGELVG
jgi:MAF protein